jgi:hypothetical protein
MNEKFEFLLKLMRIFSQGPLLFLKSFDHVLDDDDVFYVFFQKQK